MMETPSYAGRWIDLHTHRLDGPPSTWALPSLEPEQFDEASAAPRAVSLGLHPWRLAEGWPRRFAELARLAASPRVWAIGECGLDKARGPELATQLEALEGQALLAERLGKPLVLHCVRAYAELLSLRLRLRPRQAWLLHGFSSSPEMAKALAASGFLLGFGHMALRPGKARASFALAPAAALALETDDRADLDLLQLYAQLAPLRGLEPEELRALVEDNARRFFGHAGG